MAAAAAPPPASARGVRLRAALLGILVAAGLALAGPAPGAAAPPATGTPVLGSALLMPEQIVAWYAATGITPTSPVPVPELAARFIDEGAAQGVRGDIAFAQSMLETGYLRFGGIVQPSDLNFSGLGACDSCPSGLAFPTAQLGVRAQIQHLYAYAAAGAVPTVLARPLADVRFARVQPAGRAPLWDHMGNGNWATGPDYARKVLTIWRAMLAHAGLPEPPPRPAGGTPDLGVLVSPDGAARLSGWRVRAGTVAEGVSLLGAPSSLLRRRSVCLVRWDALGAAVLARGGAHPCATGTATMRWSRLSGPGWHTARGLAPGDPVSRLRALYPRARAAGSSWRLVAGREPGVHRPVTRLRAEVADGVVRALWVYPSAQPPLARARDGVAQ